MSDDVETSEREEDPADAQGTAAGERGAEDEHSASPPARRPLWLGVYLAAFVLVVASLAVLGFAGVSQLRTGSTIQGSTDLFWVSIVLAVASIVLAVAAVVLARRRS